MLKVTRQSKGVTQIELAARLGNTQTFVSKMERGGRRLDAIELIEVLEALEVDPKAWLDQFIIERKNAQKRVKSARKISMQ
ncbi:helix-turn-helix domain-containing protein [Dyella kyungheensis]|nr:helix-turn-helix transcriptional regulator [Dyella kyungheensis]